jgi:hypothetical protein
MTEDDHHAESRNPYRGHAPHDGQRGEASHVALCDEMPVRGAYRYQPKNRASDGAH